MKPFPLARIMMNTAVLRIVRRSTWIVACLGAFSTLKPSLVAEEVLVRDTFTLGKGSRTADASLAGVSPEKQTGNAVWKAGPGKPPPHGLFSAEGTIVARASQQTGEAFHLEMRIAIPQPVAATTVSAAIVNDSSDWVGIGFLSGDAPESGGWFTPEGSLLWILIRPDGRWTLYRNGTSQLVASGTVKPFSVTERHTLGLEYDPGTRQARPFLASGDKQSNLHRRPGGWLPVDLPADTAIKAVGFRIHPRSDGTSVPGASSVDDFLVTTRQGGANAGG